MTAADRKAARADAGAIFADALARLHPGTRWRVGEDEGPGPKVGAAPATGQLGTVAAPADVNEAVEPIFPTTAAA